MDFIRAEMQPRTIRRRNFAAEFINDFFQRVHALLRAHLETHRPLETRAVARHVQFGKNRDVPVARVADQFADVGEGVNVSLIARLEFRVVELRKHF